MSFLRSDAEITGSEENDAGSTLSGCSSFCRYVEYAAQASLLEGIVAPRSTNKFS
jgi:hypothetical protein